MNYNEQILGPLPIDNLDGKFYQSKDKLKFVRFYDTGFREVIHRHQEYWVVSIGYKNRFTLGHKDFNSHKEAENWSNNRDDQDLWILEQIKEEFKDW